MRRHFFRSLFLAAASLSTLFSSSGYATEPERVLTVGPGPVIPGVHYNKIQDAIDLFQGTNALYTEIQMHPELMLKTYNWNRQAHRQILRYAIII